MFYVPKLFRRRLHTLLIAQSVLGLLELVSIWSILPLLFLMVDPEVLTRNSLTKDIYDLLGFQTHEGFFQFVVIGFVSLIIFMFVYKYVYQRSSVLFVAELQKDVQKFLYDQVASTPYSDLVDMHPAKYTRFLLSQ